MSRTPSVSLLDHFSALRDPRQQWRVVYPLPEILLLVLCATLCGMDDFLETRLWGEQRLDFLRRFLPYDRGIPAHDTLNDVVNALDPDLFRACFTSWVETLRDRDPDIVSIDGKTSRRSHARGKGREPLHTVSAWASRQRLVLGQEAVDAKSNEITAIPRLQAHGHEPRPRPGRQAQPQGPAKTRQPQPSLSRQTHPTPPPSVNLKRFPWHRVNVIHTRRRVLNSVSMHLSQAAISRLASNIAHLSFRSSRKRDLWTASDVRAATSSPAVVLAACSRLFSDLFRDVLKIDRNLLV